MDNLNVDEQNRYYMNGRGHSLNICLIKPYGSPEIEWNTYIESIYIHIYTQHIM